MMCKFTSKHTYNNNTNEKKQVKYKTLTISFNCFLSKHFNESIFIILYFILNL